VILRQNKEQLINLLLRAKDIDIREDKQVFEGIILQTESGVIDAQLKTQVEEITRLLGL
jgi:flagellar biosynthesis/type III secretory pathway protein FliH